MRSVMIVASDDFPVPEEELEMVGLRAKHVGRNPHSVPPDCVGVVTVPKMMSHTMFKLAKKAANRAGVRFGVANSATGILRLMEEWGLAVAPKVEVMPSSKILGGETILRVHPPRPADPVQEPVVEEPVVQEPVAEVKPVVEEESVKKLKAWVQPDYTDVAALVAGLPEGPYDTYADIAVEANRWKEIRASKRAFRESPWKTTAFSAVLKIAFEFGIVYGVRGRWFIKRDPKIVLTPLDGVKAEPKNGHAVPALPPPPPAPVKVEPEVKHEPEMTSFQIDIPKSLLDTLAAIHLEGVVKGAMKADGLKAARSHGLIADSTWLPAARTEIIGILRFNLGESRIS